MSTRITNQDLENVTARIARKLSLSIAIEYAYGRPRAYYASPKPGTYYRELSPRLPKPALYEWLTAFESGIDAAWQAWKDEGILSDRNPDPRTVDSHVGDPETAPQVTRTPGIITISPEERPTPKYYLGDPAQEITDGRCEAYVYIVKNLAGKGVDFANLESAHLHSGGLVTYTLRNDPDAEDAPHNQTTEDENYSYRDPRESSL